jgi:iron-sulfur cluster assembly accessory protein
MADSLIITDRAANRIREIATADGAQALRIAVLGGGCSGFQYEFSMSSELDREDLEFTHAGARVLVDATSLPFLKGSTLDYVDDLMGQSFRVQNPQAKSSCGCGTSFSL